MSGKVLLELKPQIFSGRIFEIDGTKFSKGIYFLNVYSTNRIDSRKVIIE
ncbi:MAG: T9SS type A sorting domain-containing protein [Bacteroidetes bacterium]|nr:T9SS type A sorting domain-containing protein [Bacteroidota bacterium]